MRYQGRIVDWKEHRGFGFITPNGGGARVFVHIKSLRRGEPRPDGNELVTYELVTGDAKGAHAQYVAYVERVRAAPRTRHGGERRGFRFSPWVTVALLVAMGFYSWQQIAARFAGNRGSAESPGVDMQDPAPTSLRSFQPAEAGTATFFKCEGKTHCSQMNSCAEATFYLKNCPGVKIDGDRNGIPCEKQHC